MTLGNNRFAIAFFANDIAYVNEPLVLHLHARV